MANDPVAEFCKKANVDPTHVNGAEKKLLRQLSQSELDALVSIHQQGLNLRPIARVGSSGF